MAIAQPAARPVAPPVPPTPSIARAAPADQRGSLANSALHVVPRAPISRREAWLLGALAAALHGGILYWAVQAPTPVLPVVPPQVPPMTLEFSQPAPPAVAAPVTPPPVAAPAPMEPPPPVEDELATKPAPKPAPKPKPVVKAPPKARPEQVKPAPTAPAQPAPVPTPAPVAAPAPPATPAPAPVTPPSASAGYLKNPAPEYPSLAQRRGWEGTVLLRVHVLASGSPSDIQIQQSAGRQQLDEAAVAAVRRWSFAPARQGNQAVDGWVTVPIDFKIR